MPAAGIQYSPCYIFLYLDLELLNPTKKCAQLVKSVLVCMVNPCFFPEMCSTVVMATGQLTFWKTARRRLLQFVVTWIGDAEPTYLQTLQYPVHHSHEIVYKKWNGKYALFITPTLHGVRFRIYILDLRGVWMAGVKPRTPMSTVNACRAFLGRYWNNHCMFGAI